MCFMQLSNTMSIQNNLKIELMSLYSPFHFMIFPFSFSTLFLLSSVEYFIYFPSFTFSKKCIWVYIFHRKTRTFLCAVLSWPFNFKLFKMRMKNLVPHLHISNIWGIPLVSGHWIGQQRLQLITTISKQFHTFLHKVLLSSPIM